jgi:beta-glucosidase
MKKATTITLFMFSLFATAQQSIDQKVNDLLKKMTIEEKIGQLNQ